MSYDSVVAGLSPKIFWKLDETSGTTATDSGSLGINGTYANGIALNQGAIYDAGNSVHTDGTDDHVAATTSAFSSWTAITIAGWVRPDSDYDEPYGAGLDFGSGNLPIYVGLGNSQSYSIYSAGWFDGSWHYTYGSGVNARTGVTKHIAASLTEGGTFKFYVDGQPMGTISSVPSGLFSGWTGSHFYVGRRWDNTSPTYSQAKYSGWAVWDTQLSDANILAMASAGIHPQVTGETSAITIVAEAPTSSPNLIQGETAQIYYNANAGDISNFTFNEPVPEAVMAWEARVPWTTPDQSTPDPGSGGTNSGTGGAQGGFEVTLRGGHIRVVSASTFALVNLRPALNVQLNMPAAAIRNGYPYVPKVWSKPSHTTTITMGSSHGRVIPDTDPVSHPLPGGITSATYRWTASDLTAPGSSPYELSSWPEHGGSGPNWTSSGVYRPTVRQHVEFGRKDQFQTYSKSVLFHPSDVNHMWLDMGSSISQPFTFMFAGIILSYPTRTYGHYILDAGKSQPQLNVNRDHRVNDGLSYRSLMLFQRTSAILCSRPRVEDGVYVRSRHNYIPRARVMFGVFNGSNSYVGFFDHENHVIKKGKIDTKTHRYFVTGRRTNYISDNLASHMLLFEIRYFNSALSKKSLLSNYRQLAGTWKFNHYNDI